MVLEARGIRILYARNCEHPFSLLYIIEGNLERAFLGQMV